MPFSSKLKQSEYHKKWHFENREQVLEKQRTYRLLRKAMVLEKYSDGKAKCGCCGENRIQFLTVDHIDGGGTRHRKSLKSSDIYAWLVRNNYPEGFRVLCNNCNQAIGHYGKCPHVRD